MEITEVRVALCDGFEKRLKAYATLTFDRCFVVRNVKIIDGKNGLFVAMPSRRPKAECGACRYKGEAGGRYCPQCGAAMPPLKADTPEALEAQAHRDIAHPITAEFRTYLQQVILQAYDQERAKGPAASQASHD